MSLRNTFMTAVSGVSIAASAVLSAQQPPRQQTPAQPQQQGAASQPAAPNQRGGTPGTTRAGQGMQQGSEQLLAACVAIANQKEVALGQFAQDKAQHEDVKAFAAMLVKDHQAFLQKLGQHSPEAARNTLSSPSQTTPSGSRNDTTTTNRASGVQTAGGTASSDPAIRQTAADDAGNRAAPGAQAGRDGQARGRAIDLIQLDREVAQKCLESAKQELGEKQGAEFDKCFIGMQIAAHSAMKDRLAVYQKHVSPELQQVLAEGQKTTEQHLEKAKEIMEQLADSSDTDSPDRAVRRQERRSERQEESKTNKNE